MNRTLDQLAATNDPASGDWAVGTAVGLSLIPSGLFVLASFYLLLGGGLGPMSARVILVIVVAGALYLARRVGGDWKCPAMVVAVTLLVTTASHIVIDTSYDGQEYQYDATRALADGWNPYHETYQPPAELRGYVTLRLWPQHYPQAAWLAAAVPAAAGLDMETTKLAPLLLAAALFFGVFGAATAWSLDWTRSLVLAVLAAANPIIIVQLFTRMNDGQLAACLALTVLFAALWSRDRRVAFALTAGGAMAYGLNLKFSAIPTFALLSVLIALLILVTQGRSAAFRVSGGLLTAGVVSVLVLGAHPYVTNTLRYRNPFYPVAGAGAVDIMAINRPAVLSGESAVERLVQSYFAVTSNGTMQSLKLPFTVQPGELWASGNPDTRLAGFGPLFSGAVLLAAGLGGWIAWRDATRTRRAVLAAAFCVAVGSLSLPEAWWARYVPQLWWVPAIVAVVALFSEEPRVRIVGWALVVIMLLNSAFVSAGSTLYAGRRTLDARHQVAEIADRKRPICIFLGANHARLELLHSAGVRTRLRSEPLPAECHPTLLVSAFASPPGQSDYCSCPN